MPRSRAAKRKREVSEPELIRFGISIPEELLREFDDLRLKKNNQNRSEAIRDLIRGWLVAESWSEGKGEQIATVTIIYDSHETTLQQRLLERIRALGERLVSSHLVRLGPRQDLLMIALKGTASAIRSDADALLNTKGILHGKLVMTAGTP